MSNDDREQKLKLIELIRETIEHDNSLRKKYDIGDRFRFVRDRLHALLDQLEKHAKASEPPREKEAGGGLAEDEAVVYVYLYNAQGILIQTWKNMLIPKLFYEYSINRPIYGKKDEIEQLVRTKVNKVQHGYLAVVVKKNSIIPTDVKDAFGGQIIKVKEGSLHLDRLVAFTHNDIDYTVNDEGDIIKKKTL
jgi:hypothetical protein